MLPPTSETSVSYHNTSRRHNPEKLVVSSPPWKPPTSHRTCELRTFWKDSSFTFTSLSCPTFRWWDMNICYEYGNRKSPKTHAILESGLYHVCIRPALPTSRPDHLQRSLCEKLENGQVYYTNSTTTHMFSHGRYCKHALSGRSTGWLKSQRTARMYPKVSGLSR